MEDELYDQAKQLICETLEIPQEDLHDETRLVDDLGVDSILIVELKTRFEERYGIKIPKEILPELNTLGGVVGYLSTQQLFA